MLCCSFYEVKGGRGLLFILAHHLQESKRVVVIEYLINKPAEMIFGRYSWLLRGDL